MKPTEAQAPIDGQDGFALCTLCVRCSIVKLKTWSFKLQRGQSAAQVLLTPYQPLETWRCPADTAHCQLPVVDASHCIRNGRLNVHVPIWRLVFGDGYSVIAFILPGSGLMQPPPPTACPNYRIDFIKTLRFVHVDQSGSQRLVPKKLSTNRRCKRIRVLSTGVSPLWMSSIFADVSEAPGARMKIGCLCWIKRWKLPKIPQDFFPNVIFKQIKRQFIAIN